MRLRPPRIKRLCGERGFTMAPVVIATAFVSLVVVVSATAVKGDLQLTRNDLDHKQAYEAARAGLADYAFHLNKDTNFWTRCTSVPAPTAVNQQGSTTNRRPVPGSSGASYALELIPRTGQTSCSTSNPVGTMIEQSGPSTGTFRIRSTGYSGDSDQSIVATFKRASFLDYLYFTQLETSDPVTYPNAATIAGAYVQCTKTIAQGRWNAPIPNSGGQYCDTIVFPDWDQIHGPLHTNDALVTCGSPDFGRTSADVIEVSSPPVGWYRYSGCTGSPNFIGTFVTNAPVLTPPPTNSQLSTLAQQGGIRYTGQVGIVLNSNNTMTVRTNMSQAGTTVAMPANGVIYVANGACSSSYSPFTATYPNTSGCGNVRIRGTYSGQLTIAAENDIIVDGNLTRSGNGMLGLIANNFIRVFRNYPTQTSRSNCGDGSNSSGLNNLSINAAMLAIQHSFIVDHYNCGSPLGTLTITGAIGQKFRGAVGTFSGSTLVSGYQKNYNYDDRLRYVSPPHFLDPVESAWHIQRQTLDYP
jgi:Tfp pilus assembly protein PilX